MPNVGQHGPPGAPHASHEPAVHIVSVVEHAEPGPMHVFVAGSQHPVDAQGDPEVQQGPSS
jgi:hypothetical protein